MAEEKWEWQEVTVRLTERGGVTYSCAARRVWTITDEGEVREEGLFLRQEADGKITAALSNAPADTPLENLPCQEREPGG